jgi:hypothetical protein
MVQPTPRNLRQRYAPLFGPGIVVSRLGFETALFDIEGVHVARDRQASSWLGQQILP